MHDFDVAIASTFVGPEFADAFLLGAVFFVALFLVFSFFGGILDLVIDLIRRKLGLPVARYVRWVKEQENGGENNA